MNQSNTNVMLNSQKLQNILTREFVQIDMLMKRFNIFDATDMKRREVKHTKFLAHLLNPNESHGLGVRFLENFILNLNSEVEENKINFLNLDLLNAVVMPEVGLTSTTKRGKQIDLLILIPGSNSESKNTLIAIESKLESKESPDQLSTYHSLIESNFSSDYEKHYFFLTIRGDEPSDKQWSSVMFSNVVTPTIRTLINFHQETISDYIVSILEDYIEVIESDQIKESDVDRLAEQISDEAYTIIKQLNPDAPLNSVERIIQNRYHAAIDFLKNYDKDSRKRIPKEFEQIFKTETDLVFRHETSSRQYLRTSFLSAENEEFMINLCNKANVKWIESMRNLAYEFVLLRNPNDAKLINISLKLMLGPTNDSFTERSKFVDFLKKRMHEFLNLAKENIEIKGLKSASPCYTTLIGSRELKKFTKKSLNADQTIDHIKKTLKNDFLINLAAVTNQAIRDFKLVKDV